MAEYLSPGIYVEEFDSGYKPMEGVSTSTAGFIGMAERGKLMGSPIFISSFSEFQRRFGGYLSESSYGNNRFLAYGVEQFFNNGGTRCYVMRVAPEDGVIATYNFSDSEEAQLKVEAANPGAWGNGLNIMVARGEQGIRTTLLSGEGKVYVLKSVEGLLIGDYVLLNTVTLADQEPLTVCNKIVKIEDHTVTFLNEFDATVYEVISTEIVPKATLSPYCMTIEASYNEIKETYTQLSFHVDSPNYYQNKLEKSDLFKIWFKLSQDLVDPIGLLGKLITGEEDLMRFNIIPQGGANGSTLLADASIYMGIDGGPGKRTGLQAFIENDTVSIMAIPGITEPAVQLALVNHCEQLASRFAVLDVPIDATSPDEVVTQRSILDSSFAAMYHPWIEVYDMLNKKYSYLPPSGAILGIYARSDNTRGVQKAPANEVVKGCLNVSTLYTKAEQDLLNPKGVNLIRAIPGKGIQVWGARTCSSDANWKYVNVRRLFIYVEETIKKNTSWAVFEPNDQILWSRVERTISSFLSNLWRNGALFGATEEEAYFVKIGTDTMSQDDINNGRLICIIGIAPVKPAEFVIFRMTQKMEES